MLLFFFLSGQEEIFTSKEEQDHQQYNSGTKLNGFQKMNFKKKMLKETMLFANMPESLDRATGKQKHRGNKHDACLLARLQLFFFSPAHHQVMKS